VLQAQNVAGNLNDSLAASWHAFDHMAWDGSKYPHLSADGRHPYWVLGKGLFFRASDLIRLGGFHPWLTIEDPEVGMRFWVNGKRLGIIAGSLIEEVPSTFAHGITQRKRWVAGFFQSLGTPLRAMGMKPRDRFKAWLNFLPCLSLWLNAVGVPVGIWALWRWYDGSSPLPLWLLPLVAANLVFFALSITMLYIRTWRRTALVLDSVWARIWYMLRVNPLFVMVWWLVWLIPLAIGFKMYLRDEGLVWERTEKSDANNELVRGGVAAAPEPAARSLREASRPSAVAGMAGPSPIPSPSRSSANV
jgi:cellulose synthase/poly-beta-1,6-N-acetylglucosamine synthase-like glycosyltransferase